MSHQQAVKIHAAERYLLEELSPTERNEFEEHFFECVECANEVRSVFTFADNAKAVMAAWPTPQGAAAPEPTAPWVLQPSAASAGWWAWFRPSFLAPVAAALLLGVALYQSVLVIPGLERRLEIANSPRAIPSVVARQATRGEESVIPVSASDPFFQVLLDINTTELVSSYTCNVYDDSGALKFSVPSAAPSAGGSLNLLLPASGMEPGRYTVRVTPGNSGDYSFVLQRR